MRFETLALVEGERAQEAAESELGRLCVKLHIDKSVLLTAREYRRDHWQLKADLLDILRCAESAVADPCKFNLDRLRDSANSIRDRGRQ